MIWEFRIGKFGLIAFVLLLGACGSEQDRKSVESGNGAPADTGLADVADVANDTADTEDATIDSINGRDVPAREFGEDCAEIGECERGLICDEGSCSSWSGCAIWGPQDRFGDEAGCLIESRSGGVATAAECETDSDCANSPHGSYCVLKVCTPHEPCDTDADCPKEGESCYAGRVCLPK